MKSKQNKVSQEDSLKGEQDNTAERPNRNILKTIKLTENANIRKAI